MIKSKLSAEARTTIPKAVRHALRLRVGDEIVYHIDGDRVILTKSPTLCGDPIAAFSEWGSEADCAAYAEL